MSDKFNAKVPCPECKEYFEVTLYSSANVSIDPSLREKVFNDTINVAICPKCKHKFQVHCQLMYHDMEKQFAVWYDPLNERIKEKLSDMELNLGQSNYLFDAPISNTWDEFKGHILLYENKIIETPDEKKIHFKDLYDFILEQDASINNPKISCPNCNNIDEFGGLNHICEKCRCDLQNSGNINTLLLASLILREYINDMEDPDESDFRNNSKKALDNLIDCIKTNKRTFKNNLKKVRKVINDKGILGKNNYVAIFEIQGYVIKNVSANKELDSTESFKERFLKTLPWVLGSLNYIFNYKKNKEPKEGKKVLGTFNKLLSKKNIIIITLLIISIILSILLWNKFSVSDKSDVRELVNIQLQRDFEDDGMLLKTKYENNLMFYNLRILKKFDYSLYKIIKIELLDKEG